MDSVIHPKNKLQNFFQQKGQKIPSYSTKRVGGTDNMPLWQSTVIIQDREYTSSPRNKKIDAEKDVAEKVLAELQTKPTEKPEEKISPSIPTSSLTHIISIVGKYKNICLIDLENLPKGVNVLETFSHPDYLVIGVLSHLHHLAENKSPFILKIPSSVKDAGDHFLTFICGILAGKVSSTDTSAKDTFFRIFSRDHYAEATVIALRQVGLSAEHFTGLDFFNSLIV